MHLPGVAPRVALSTLVAASVAIASCSGGEPDALERARREGVIRIGYSVEAPYALLKENGDVTGEAPEIARVITERLGVERVDWRLAEFGSLIDGLESHRFDVIASGMLITPERSRRIAFSAPTFRASWALLVRAGNPRELHSYGDLMNDPEVRVVVLHGAVEEAYLLRAGFPEARLVRTPDALSGCMLVGSGGADALALTAPTVRRMVRNKACDGVEMADPFYNAGAEPVAPEWGAFAFRKDDAALRKAWDAELAKFVGSPEHRSLMSRLGFKDAEMPGASEPATAAAPP